MAEEKSWFSKNVLPIILLALFLSVLLIAGIYAYAWLNTEAGQRQWVSLKEGFTKYNPITLLTKQVEDTQRTVSWTGEEDAGALKQGIILNSFSSLTTRIQAGADLLLKYDLTTRIPSGYSVPTEFYCKISSTGAEGEILPPNPAMLTSTKKPSIRCKFSGEQTANLNGPTKIEGGLTFPYSTENSVLPVYFAREAAATDFFSKYGIDEKQPIRTKYNQEPVELALGVSDENVQPVIVSDTEYPMVGIAVHNRWDGKIKSITSLELQLPPEVTINQEITKNPSTLCPFETLKSEKGKNVYRAQTSMLNEQENMLDEKKVGTTKIFECWLSINPEIIPADEDYTRGEYSASISYVYETNPKTTVVTISDLNTPAPKTSTVTA